MYPELFRIGSFPINTYGVFLALAFLSAIMITVRLAGRDGVPRERIYDLCLWILLASLVGSKVLMLFTEPDYRLHPTQLYESFSMLIVFFFLLWLHRQRRFSGQVILAYALIYAVVRFVIEFFRDDPRGDIFGLTTLTGLSTSQLIGIVVGLAALVLLIVRWRNAAAIAKADRVVVSGAARA